MAQPPPPPSKSEDGSKGPSSSSSSSSSSPSSISSSPAMDPILRNALRYTVSAKEYKLVHEYLLSRASLIKKRSPPPQRYEAIVESKNDFNVATVRLALRVFLATYVGFKGWEVATQKIQTWRNGPSRKASATTSAGPKSGNLRISASLALILLFHRLLHRFFLRLRASLLDPSARPFRRRNPRVALALTSPYTPAIGSALSGLLLGVCPKSQLRISIAIYTAARALEFAYNAAEDEGIWGSKGKPAWVGSWLLMPFAFGQLLHAFVFDRDCFPEAFGQFILKRSPEYVQHRPSASVFPKDRQWPSNMQLVDGLAEISKSRWPAFVSPILAPAATQLLPSLSNVSVVTSRAHPSITHTSCALLHPHDPSCSRTHLKYFLAAFPTNARTFALIYAAFSLLSWKAIAAHPTKHLNALAARILRMSLFVTGAIGTSWGSICLFANHLPRNFLSTQRWFLGGFVGGLWAFVARRGERSNFLYSARLSADSLWKVGVKRGWWKGWRHGDVVLFAAGLAVVDVLFATRNKAVKGAMIRRGMDVLRGQSGVVVGGGNASSTSAPSASASASPRVNDEEEGVDKEE